MCYQIYELIEILLIDWNFPLLQVGLCLRKFALVSGSILAIWDTLERELGDESKMQIVRLKLSDNKKIIGILLASHSYKKLTQALRTKSK